MSAITMPSPVAQFHLTGGALAIVAAVIGAFVARALMIMAQKAQSKTRVLLMFSLINLSLLILIWSLPRAVGAHSPIAAILTAPPLLFYIIPASALVAASLAQRNRSLLPLNACIWAGALWGVLGFRFAVVAPADVRTPFRVISWNVGQTPLDLHAVVTVLRKEHPDIICLQGSAGSGDPGDAVGHLPDYHWYRSGSLAIGSLGALTGRRQLTLLPGTPQDRAIIAVAHVSGLDVTVAAAEVAPGTSTTTDAADAAQVLSDALDPAHRTVVVATALGAQPASPSWQVLSHDLADVFDRSGTGFGYTTPAAFPVRRLDYVFSSHDLIVKTADVESDRGGADFPVTATLGTAPPAPPAPADSN